MDEILNYLQMKNKFYEKYYQVSRKLLQCLQASSLERLEYFTDSRERILSILNHFDHKITFIFENLALTSAQVEEFRAPLKACFDRRDELATKVMALDLEVIAKMEELKNETIRELRKTVDSRQQVTAFERNLSAGRSRAGKS